MAGTIGRAFKINEQDVKGYGYVEPKDGRKMKRNPGVTAIAAVNGRGSYRRRNQSARQVMSGLSGNKRRSRAKKLTKSELSAFERRVQEAKRSEPMLRANMSRREAGKKNIKAAQRTRKNWGRYVPKGTRIRVGPAKEWHSSVLDYGSGADNYYKGKLAPGVYEANKRRKPTRRKATAKRRKATPAQLRALAKGRRVQAAKRRATMKPNRRKTVRRAAPGRRVSAAAKRSAAARKAARTRKMNQAKRRAAGLKAARTRKRNMKPNRRAIVRRAAPARRRRMGVKRGKQTAAQRRASMRNLAKARLARMKPNRRRAGTKRRRVSASKRKSYRRNNQTAAQRRASMRNIRKAQAASRRGKGRSKALARRPRTRKGYRKNARKRDFLSRVFRANSNTKMTTMEALSGAFTTGLVITGGFLTHKLLTKGLCWLIDQVFPPPSPVVTMDEPEPEATDGIAEAIAPYKDLLCGIVVAGVGIAGTNMILKEAKYNQTKLLICGGMATSLLHTVIVTALDQFAPAAATYLSGYDSDSTAARLSAMMGTGAVTIQPMYDPISGLGASQSPFEAAAGMGEYFESGVEGLGNYVNNPDVYQAAAGMGAGPEYQGNHIDPTSDLDSQLSVAEAAAGVGQTPSMYQAAAGMGEYMLNPAAPMSGLGEYLTATGDGVQALPTTSTWIPGESDPQLWAGVKSVDRAQGATAMDPGGILSTAGGAGILG